MNKFATAIRNNIPNAVTCLNLLFGSMAIVAAFSPMDTLLWGLKGYQLAFLLIALAAVADFCDGFAARLLHAVSPLGAELDSLSDCVSFGLAPALILYNVMTPAGQPAALSLTALIIPVFGALRLARFNVSTDQTTTFTGLPIPANALFWIGFVNYYAAHPGTHAAIVVVAVLLLSWLMVCNLRMFSLKVHSLSLKESYRQYLLVVVAVVALALQGVTGCATLIAAYVVLSLVFRSE